jgi:hypothetical protein
MRVGIILGVCLTACMTGTETDVIVTTDLPCSSISNAIVSLSGLQTSMTCTGAGDFGIAVYHPTDTQTDVVVVATTDKSDPAQCLTAPGAACIVARRKAPVAYQTNVPVNLEQACAGVACTATTTCMNGICTSF